MPRADLLVDLFKSATHGDRQTFRKIAEAMIQEEKSKGRRILADRLRQSLIPGAPSPDFSPIPKPEGNGGRHRDFIHEMTPERGLASIVLSESTENQIRELVEEQHRVEILHAYNLTARSRILLTGPPGNGKTTLAEALAFELMYPLLVIRYETLVGSYLGETAGRLKNVLDYAKTQRCVLFLDEFETLAKERGDTHETGEIKRVVSSLLLQMDALPDYVVVAAASNHPELLDRAVWRRFQLRIDLPMPGRRQLEVFIASFFQRCQINPGYTAETLARHLEGHNFAEVEEFCVSVARRAVLRNQTENAKSIVKTKLEQWKTRVKAPAEIQPGKTEPQR